MAGAGTVTARMLAFGLLVVGECVSEKTRFTLESIRNKGLILRELIEV